MKRLFNIILFSCAPFLFYAATKDTLSVKESKSFWQVINESLQKFSEIDTNYIEPQLYNFEFMVQNTNTYEIYNLKNAEGIEVAFAPEVSYKIGPYFGWRWIFLGYTVDVSHLSKHNRRTEFDLSFYTSQIGIDLFYKESGNDYKLKRLSFPDRYKLPTIRNRAFDGFSASIKGFNLYYIVNHKKFSYPAAFSQSTVQRRSAGSMMFGLGYMKQTINLDIQKLNKLVSVEDDANTLVFFDKNTKKLKVEYVDISLSGGYGYNWVFAKNWLFASSLSLGLGYKHSKGDKEHEKFRFRDFTFSNFNLDAIGRFGIVWNNSKWYAGISSIVHSYNYKKNKFATNTTFGNLNIYVGFNFLKRKK